jgi:hypothetical protein
MDPTLYFYSPWWWNTSYFVKRCFHPKIRPLISWSKFNSMSYFTKPLHLYRVSQKLLCSKVPRTTLQFFLQQMLEMSPTSLKTRLDTLLHCATGVLSSAQWGKFPTSAVGRTATWYVVLYCTVAFGTLCINDNNNNIGFTESTTLHARWVNRTLTIPGMELMHKVTQNKVTSSFED